jgi:predicted small secreted protein
VAAVKAKWQNHLTMKLTPRTLLLLILVGLQSLIVAGCANTGRGLKADAEHNADKVEAELRH